MDSAGRIVLPKSVRENLRLGAGAELTLSENDDKIILAPAGAKSRLVKKEGLWVIGGLSDRDVEWSRLVEDDRRERNRHLLGSM